MTTVTELAGYVVSQTPSDWLDWEYVRALEPFAAEDRRALFHGIVDLMSVSPAVLLPREVAWAACDLLFGSPGDTGNAKEAVKKGLLFPWLERVAHVHLDRLDEVAKAWPSSLALTDGNIEELTRRGRLSSKHLKMLVAALPNAPPLAEMLKTIDENRMGGKSPSEAVLALARVGPLRRDEFLRLWQACAEGRALPRSQVPAPPVTGGTPALTPRDASIWSRICGLRWSRLRGWNSQPLSEAAQMWVKEAVRESVLTPLGLAVIQPDERPKAGTAWGGDVGRDAAVLLLLASPPPPEVALVRRLVSAVDAIWRAESCLPTPMIDMLASLIDHSAAKDEIVLVCLEAMLVRRPGRGLGLRERIAGLLALEKTAVSSRRTLRFLARALAECES
jgi:hypothetical protein